MAHDDEQRGAHVNSELISAGTIVLGTDLVLAHWIPPLLPAGQ